MRATSPTSRPAAATAFCGAFTQYTTTATTYIPAFAATACTNNAVKISSACSCLPTPTPTACSFLIQNGDFSQDTTQDADDIPHWTTQCPDYYCRVQNFGSNVFWFKYENDNNGNINNNGAFSLEQSFTRCAGVTYNLTLDYYMDDWIPPNYPVTIQVQVGLYGSVPQTTDELVLQYYPNPTCQDCGDESSEVDSSGPWTVQIPPLSKVPAPGYDGVRITVTYPETMFVEMYIHNVTLVATS